MRRIPNLSHLLCRSIMSTISEQPKGCDVYPYKLTMITGEKWCIGMDASHNSCSEKGSCDDCLCVCFPFTIAIDTVACPVTTPWWLVSKLVKWCKDKKQSSESVVVNA